MMTPIYFNKKIKNLEIFFGSITEEQRDALYEMFKKTDEYLFSKAVEYLEENYKYKHFPLPGDFTEAIEEIRDRMRWDTKTYEEICEHCQGEGIELVDKYSDFYNETKKVARPCKHCNRGKRVFLAWSEYDKKRIKVYVKV